MAWRLVVISSTRWPRCVIFAPGVLVLIREVVLKQPKALLNKYWYFSVQSCSRRGLTGCLSVDSKPGTNERRDASVGDSFRARWRNVIRLNWELAEYRWLRNICLSDRMLEGVVLLMVTIV